MSHKYLWKATLSEDAPRKLHEIIGDGPLLIVAGSAFLDIRAKIELLKKATNWTIVWFSKQLTGYSYLENTQYIIADFPTLIKLVNRRKTRKNTVFLCVHAACSFASVPNISKACPGVKIISYAYDWQNIFCPREHVDLWKQYVPGGRSVAPIEYDAIEEVQKGRFADGLLYKDGGEDSTFLNSCPTKKKWMPPAYPIKYAEDPPEENVPNRLVYIGTIVPKRTHGRKAGLFEDIMLEDIFGDVAEQGWDIDAYLINIDQDVKKEYLDQFKKNKVKLFNGAPVEKLWPHMAGRYRFGWMLYYWPCKIIMDHVKISIPIKLFTYIHLGVPILVSEELESCAKIIKKYKCGIVFNQRNIKNLNRVINHYDYKKLLQGVKKAREELCLENYIDGFIDFVKEIMEKPLEKTKTYQESQKETTQKSSAKKSKSRRSNTTQNKNKNRRRKRDHVQVRTRRTYGKKGHR